MGESIRTLWARKRSGAMEQKWKGWMRESRHWNSEAVKAMEGVYRGRGRGREREKGEKREGERERMRDGKTRLISSPWFLAATRLQDFLDQPSVEVNFSSLALFLFHISFFSLSLSLSFSLSLSLSLFLSLCGCAIWSHSLILHPCYLSVFWGLHILSCQGEPAEHLPASSRSLKGKGVILLLLTYRQSKRPDSIMFFLLLTAACVSVTDPSCFFWSTDTILKYRFH